jgi:hypothetical protein
MSNLKGIPVVEEAARARSGEKYVTPQGFTAIRDGIKGQGPGAREHGLLADSGRAPGERVTPSGKPPWLRAKAPAGAGFQGVKAIVK